MLAANLPICLCVGGRKSQLPWLSCSEANKFVHLPWNYTSHAKNTTTPASNPWLAIFTLKWLQSIWYEIDMCASALLARGDLLQHALLEWKGPFWRTNCSWNCRSIQPLMDAADKFPGFNKLSPSIGVWKTRVWATGELIRVVRYPNLMTLQSQRLSFAALRKVKKDIENLLIAGAQSRRRETLVIKSEARSDNLLFPLSRLPITPDFCRSKEV